MDIPDRLIIDIETKKGAFGFWVNDKKVDLVSGGKEIIHVSKNEQNLRIYKLLAEQCDLIFCTNQEPDDFPFYPIPSFWIFAVDSKGNCFGTIGGWGNIADDEVPVGYVSYTGMYGKVANSLKDFLSLAVFYPGWRDIIRNEQTGISYNIDHIKIQKIESDPIYLEQQREIQELLKITKNSKSLELLISNIKSKNELMIYPTKEEAQKSNRFLDTENLAEELVRLSSMS